MTRKPRKTAKGKVPGKKPSQAKGGNPAKRKTKATTTPAKKAARRSEAGRRRRPPATHWLVRPETIRGLWIGGFAVLAVVVAVETWVHPHGYFGIDGTFAFNAWFGFAACVAMIAVANVLGKFLKRRDTYYDAD